MVVLLLEALAGHPVPVSVKPVGIAGLVPLDDRLGGSVLTDVRAVAVLSRGLARS